MAEVITRIAERINNHVKPSATTMSGQPESANQTALAATNTEMFDAMSFREHTHTEFIFTSSFR